MLRVRLSTDVNALGRVRALTFIGDFIISAADVNRALNEVGSFSFSLPAASLTEETLPFDGNDPRYTVGNLFGLSATLILDGVEQISGIVNNVSIDYVSDELIYKFSCDAELIQLAKLRAKTNAVYQNRQVLSIVADLLDGYFWKIGDVSSMEDPLITTTIDLRGEKHLLPQLKKVLESVPNLFFRYGGDFLPTPSSYPPYHYLDIGAFNVEVPTLVKQEEISDLSQVIKYSGLISKIEAYGGEITVAGNKRRINLLDALSYDPTLGTISLYPPFFINASRKTLENSLILQFVGDEIVEYFDEIAPLTKVDPSADEIKQAGYALFLKTLALMQQAQFHEDQWSAALKELPSDFLLGNSLFLRSNARQIFYNYHTQRASSIDLGQVAQWYRVNGYTLQVKEVDLTYKLDLATNLRLSSAEDPIVALYESVNQTPQIDESALATPISEYEVLFGVVPVDLEPDSFTGDADNPYPARSIQIPVSSMPPGKTIALIAIDGTSNRSRAIFSTTPNTTLLLRSEASKALGEYFEVAVSVNGNWTGADTADIYILVEYF